MNSGNKNRCWVCRTNKKVLSSKASWVLEIKKCQHRVKIRLLKDIKTNGGETESLWRKNGTEIKDNLGIAQKLSKYSASFQSEEIMLSMEQKAEWLKAIRLGKSLRSLFGLLRANKHHSKIPKEQDAK